MIKLFYIFIIKSLIYGQCSPIEIALYMNNADGWMFPYSAYYNGINTAYSEIYLIETFWPDFRERELMKAILDYQSRERRFGKVSEQVSN